MLSEPSPTVTATAKVAVSPTSHPSSTPKVSFQNPEAMISVSSGDKYCEFAIQLDEKSSQYVTLLRTGPLEGQIVREFGVLPLDEGVKVKDEMVRLVRMPGVISESGQRCKRYYITGETRGNYGCQFGDVDIDDKLVPGCRQMVEKLPSTYVGRLFQSRGMVLPKP